MPDTVEQVDFIKSRGILFPDDPTIITRKRRRLLRQNTYEQKETEAVLRNIQASDTVIELGAGMGYMSSFVAARLGVRNVHAFEANPRLIPYIKAVHAQNGLERIKVYNAVLGPRKGKAKFYVRDDFVASSLSKDAAGGVTSVESIPVMNAQKTFDEIQPTALICDIEGAEADLLKKIDLSCLRCAVIELHPQWIGQEGVQAVFDAMAAGGLTYSPRASEGKVVTFLKGW
ncbi:FkbM family methyltransferase [Actibacterium lipolyticum]|uniref:Methyltransferase FkbM domain-containing protein n=1 Tax=Actibacterium lipolyticum TaxID=1524263 RepID=A0A238JUH0_9RHOB|nr:FkbM family methyltransferase [Actibacterium lipolyticum]SMX34280.1 hypothetical protein COL8621_01238 [Actibacterium lipolyticum]